MPLPTPEEFEIKIRQVVAEMDREYQRLATDSVVIAIDEPSHLVLSEIYNSMDDGYNKIRREYVVELCFYEIYKLDDFDTEFEDAFWKECCRLYGPGGPVWVTDKSDPKGEKMLVMAKG